jgi:hypothetical protein
VGPETRFKEKVLKDLALIPQTWVLKTQERSRRGVPDLLVCLKGKFVAIELKVDDEPTMLQAHILKRIHAASGVAFSTTPEEWAAHYAMLKELAAA